MWSSFALSSFTLVEFAWWDLFGGEGCWVVALLVDWGECCEDRCWVLGRRRRLGGLPERRILFAGFVSMLGVVSFCVECWWCSRLRNMDCAIYLL